MYFLLYVEILTCSIAVMVVTRTTNRLEATTKSRLLRCFPRFCSTQPHTMLHFASASAKKKHSDPFWFVHTSFWMKGRGFVNKIEEFVAGDSLRQTSLIVDVHL